MGCQATQRNSSVNIIWSVTTSNYCKSGQLPLTEFPYHSGLIVLMVKHLFRKQVFRVRISIGPPESTQGLLEFSRRTKNSNL